MAPYTLFTDSKPKWANINGYIDQAFSPNTSLMTHLIGVINAGTIATIGTVSLVSTTLQFVLAPQIHTDLGGNPIAIIGNSPNKFGEFSCVKIDIMALQLFPYIFTKELLAAVPHGDHALPADILVDTNWSAFTDPLHGSLIPNFFFLYFGQAIPQGEIHDYDVKVQMSHLGLG
jgi:hypothetical protein